jgi:hypothetical protein
MATSRVTPDADAIESEVQIAAPAERFSRRWSILRKCRSGGGRREFTGVRNFTPICEPEENGGPWEWAETGVRSR